MHAHRSKRRRKPKSKPQPPPKPKQILSFELENRAVIEDFDLNNDDQIDTSSLLSDQNSSLKGKSIYYGSFPYSSYS